MERVLVAVALVAVVAVIAAVLRRRSTADAPTQVTRGVPAQLDRADFARPDAEWLLVVFSSATCSSCADVVAKARVVASDAVAVQEVEWSAHRELHRRYAIDSVPITVLADRAGVVRASFTGPVTATDLWAAIASAREV